MGQKPDEDGQVPRDWDPSENGADPNLRVLSDLLVYDTEINRWSFAETEIKEGVQPALARYAHLSALSNGCLIILVLPLPEYQRYRAKSSSCQGGQDILNRYIEQLCCLELETMTYVHTGEWKGHAGSYRSIATSRSVSVNKGGIPTRPATGRGRGLSFSTMESNQTTSTSFADETLQLPFSVAQTSEEPVYTFTNYNFAEVRRALDMISAPSSPDYQSSVIPLSEFMVGSPSLPPGLRFPTASMVGTHLVLTGTLITQQISSFAIWTLDLNGATTPNQASERPTLVWQKIDAGHALKTGSWNRAVTWRNSVVILGDRDRDIAIDYNRRQNNFVHIAFIDLEVCFPF